jgi:hypothetical protein
MGRAYLTKEQIQEWVANFPENHKYQIREQLGKQIQ